jgi:hypothetical protein
MMKLLGTLLSIQRITLRVGRSAVLLGVAWVGPAQANAVQPEMRSYQAQEQRIALDDFLPCASCYGPPFGTVRTVGGDDQAGFALPGWRAQFGGPIDSYEIVRCGPVRPVIALRVLYCCWRN